MTSLIDQFRRPLRDLRISVTDRCNFRCSYCMPADVFHDEFKFLHHDQILRYEEITRLARIAVGLGVVKLRITGGEPLVRRDLDQLIAQLTSISGVEDIAMTTNGFLLEKMAQPLKDAGLARVTISLDSLDNDVFRRMNGDKADVAPVLAGIRAAEQAGLTPIKVNAVVQRGVNDHTMVDLARFCKDNGYVLRFIEFMDVGTRNGWKLDQVVPAKEIIERIDAALPLERVEGNYYGEVAERHRYRDGGGEIGVIASVTQPFCGTCTRLRLSADGRIYTCLFALRGTSLRDPMRAGATDDELATLFAGVWSKRKDRYSEIRTEETAANKKIEMNYIGG
ncbi:MAG: GTP 3',8-cyclase MoaA [Anaerolinea sp.]|nr:GTP 3',8-cyclase MoaA [Anaerolinea sp.]